MKKLKIYFALFTVIFYQSSFSQITLSEPKKITSISSNRAHINTISNVAKNRGLIVGYAYNCQFDKDDILIVRQQFINFLFSIQIPKEDKNLISNAFDESVSEALKNGLDKSKMSCSTFKINFDKIVESVKKENNLTSKN